MKDEECRVVVIHHSADFDGLFCREIARKFLPTAELVGWDYGDPVPEVPDHAVLYMLDISVEGLMDHPRLVWLDHHKSAMEKFPASIPGWRMDGVAACRLAWQWFTLAPGLHSDGEWRLPSKQDFVERRVSEPLAVRLAGEYDIWDKRDPNAELFQHGLRSQELSPEHWRCLLSVQDDDANPFLLHLLSCGKALQYAQRRRDESLIRDHGFTVQWEGLTFLACNAPRCNSLLFTAGLQPEHDACLAFAWDGQQWRVSLYHAPGREHHDLSLLAVKHGGGGHRGACGFRLQHLPFLP